MRYDRSSGPTPWAGEGRGNCDSPTPLLSYIAPRICAAFLRSRCFTHRIAAHRPIPLVTASTAVTLIFASPSRVIVWYRAPTRSSPSIRKHFFGPLSLIFACFAAATKAAPSAGTKSAWDFLALGNAEKARRLTPALRRTASSRAPSPALSGHDYTNRFSSQV